MKIGILTHHYINNFGAFLQAYALQTTLQELFKNDEVVLINDLNLKHFIINTGGWFRLRNYEGIKSWFHKIRVPITFAKERKKYFNLTPVVFSAKGINKLGLDCIVVGSDEVWNIKENKGIALEKFGVGLNSERLISYAPSCGKTTVDNDIKSLIKSGMEKFDAISVRDSFTENFVNNIINKSGELVLDPTFLIDITADIDSLNLKSPYILFYYCDGMPDEMKKQIIYQAHKNGYSVYGAGECNKLYDDITVNLTPFQWAGMFKNASYVFTGTFHGTVFSIKNRKQFSIYATNESRIRKIQDLLDQLEIRGREANGFEDIKVKEPIEYNSVYCLIEQKRKSSLEFLNTNIR